MTILTDELIEKAALAMRDRPRGVVYDAVMDRHRLDARACLEAILPDVVEKCAQVVERTIPYGFEPYNRVRRKSAAHIRSLLNKEGNANG